MRGRGFRHLIEVIRARQVAACLAACPHSVTRFPTDLLKITGVNALILEHHELQRWHTHQKHNVSATKSILVGDDVSLSRFMLPHCRHRMLNIKLTVIGPHTWFACIQHTVPHQPIKPSARQIPDHYIAVPPPTGRDKIVIQRCKKAQRKLTRSRASREGRFPSSCCSSWLSSPPVPPPPSKTSPPPAADIPLVATAPVASAQPSSASLVTHCPYSGSPLGRENRWPST